MYCDCDVFVIIGKNFENNYLPNHCTISNF